MSNPFRYFNSSPEIIRLAVLMYVKYPLSLRNVEDLLAERARKCRPIPDARKLRQFGATGWWSEMDSNQRYLSPYCLPRSQRLPYHQNWPQ